jgi:hypothetical protein
LKAVLKEVQESEGEVILFHPLECPTLRRGRTSAWAEKTQALSSRGIA